MPAFFSINKKTFFLGLGLLLLSSFTEVKPKSNFRILADSSKDCWIESYGRGVGKPITTCPHGYEQSGELCYPPCPEGYTGDGPVCWQNCPKGFTNTGGECLKPSSYGRGSGYAAWHESECNNDNPQGCEEHSSMWYPKCAEGFEAYGCCVCSPTCPSGMTDIGVSCQKNRHDRTAGVPLVCKASEEEDAGLCYPPCKSGYDGIGPVCWGECPAGMYKCGALCTKDAGECVSDILKIAEEVLKIFVELAEGGEDVLDIAKSGVKLTEQLASYGMCSNM